MKKAKQNRAATSRKLIRTKFSNSTTEMQHHQAKGKHRKDEARQRSHEYCSFWGKKIGALSRKQQMQVRVCFEASRRKGANGMKFEWERILEWIIICMKSPRLYDHIRTHKLMVVPSPGTSFSCPTLRGLSRFGISLACLESGACAGS